jgi:hypothetical protein
MPVIRLVCYWVASIAAAGTVAGLAHFSTYSSSHGSFWEAFALYTIPIPMAVGMFHIPTLVVGTVVCIQVSGRAGRPLTALLGIALALALAYHVVSFLRGDRDHWAYFAFVTVDVMVLFVIGLLVAPVSTRPARREIHRA